MTFDLQIIIIQQEKYSFDQVKAIFKIKPMEKFFVYHHSTFIILGNSTTAIYNFFQRYVTLLE